MTEAQRRIADALIGRWDHPQPRIPEDDEPIEVPRKWLTSLPAKIERALKEASSGCQAMFHEEEYCPGCVDRGIAALEADEE